MFLEPVHVYVHVHDHVRCASLQQRSRISHLAEDHYWPSVHQRDSPHHPHLKTMFLELLSVSDCVFLHMNAKQTILLKIGVESEKATKIAEKHG